MCFVSVCEFVIGGFFVAGCARDLRACADNSGYSFLMVAVGVHIVRSALDVVRVCRPGGKGVLVR